MAWDDWWSGSGALGAAGQQAQTEIDTRLAQQNQYMQQIQPGWGSGEEGSGRMLAMDYGAIADMNRGFYSAWQGAYYPKPVSFAERFIDSIAHIDSKFIKEIVVPENQYKELISFLKLKDDEGKKSFSYHNSYGNILLKNEAFQFDLDLYLEKGPADE